jgi:transcriptional regulator with XRE-family HTH domain
MSEFGQIIREIRLAQKRGLRTTAAQIGISAAYLSRIERGKESPPAPHIIKALAEVLAIDPDLLFQLAVATDPDILDLLQSRPKVVGLMRLIMEHNLSDDQLDTVTRAVIDHADAAHSNGVR